MPDELRFAGIEGQHVELLPTASTGDALNSNAFGDQFGGAGGNAGGKIYS